MSTIAPYSQPLVPSHSITGGRLSRQTARDLATINHSAEISTARVAAAGEIQQARIDAVARAGAYAMQQVALVSQMQQQLALAALRHRGRGRHRPRHQLGIVGGDTGAAVFTIQQSLNGFLDTLVFGNLMECKIEGVNAVFTDKETVVFKMLVAERNKRTCESGFTTARVTTYQNQFLIGCCFDSLHD